MTKYRWGGSSMLNAFVQALIGSRLLRRYVGRHRIQVVGTVSTSQTTQPVAEELR
jgi:hypothetical protein